MKVADISGMDPERKRYDYEWGCQVIMLRALHWMREHAVEAEIPQHMGFKGVTGLSLPANEAAREMEKYILEHHKIKEFGATGAMMQFGIAHAKFRFLNGDEKYLAEFPEPGRIFEFDENDAHNEGETWTTQ